MRVCLFVIYSFLAKVVHSEYLLYCLTFPSFLITFISSLSVSWSLKFVSNTFIPQQRAVYHLVFMVTDTIPPQSPVCFPSKPKLGCTAVLSSRFHVDVIIDRPPLEPPPLCPSFFLPKLSHCVVVPSLVNVSAMSPTASPSSSTLCPSSGQAASRVPCMEFYCGVWPRI